MGPGECALYGGDYKLRRMLKERRQPYVLAVRSNQTLRLMTSEGLIETDPGAIADDWPAEGWTRLPAGEGSRGLRLHDWARMALPWPADKGFERCLLIRRNRKDPDKQAYYLVFALKGATLAELAGAAGLRWTIEECFERAKTDLGLDRAPGTAGIAT